MIEEKDCHINEEEVVKTFLMFRNFSPDKQAFAIAFMNGMEFQRSLDKANYIINQKEVKAI